MATARSHRPPLNRLPFRRGTHLLFAIVAASLLSACSVPYGTALRQFREAPSCCSGMADLPALPLTAGAPLDIAIGADTPAFAFPSGKSRFLLFTLPSGDYPCRVTVTSRIVGDNPRTAYLFYPRIATLDAERRVVRASGAGTFTLRRAGYLEAAGASPALGYLLEGGLTFTGENRDERYLLIQTTDELLAGTTSLPTASDVPILIYGFNPATAKPKEAVQILHAPAGEIRIVLAPLPATPNAAPLARDEPAPTAVPPAQIAVAPAQASAATTPAPPASAPSALPAAPAPAVAPASPASPPQPAGIPARLESGREIGRLVPGKTTLDEGKSIFERSGVGFGQVTETAAAFSVAGATLTATRLAAPPGTRQQLYFDSRGILLLVMESSPPDLPKTGTAFRKKFPAARETGRTIGSYELQVALDPCLTLVGLFRTGTDALESAAYAAGCPVGEGESSR